MAFGGGGSDSEISLKFVLETAEASGNAEKFFDEFLKGIVEGALAEKKLIDGLKGIGTEAKKSSGEVEKGFSSASKSLITLNQGLELAKKAFSTVTGLANELVSAVKAGASFDDLASSFDNLTQKAGTTAAAFSGQLNSALQSTVGNADLFRISNEALFAGLKPEQILVAAEAARTFGDQLGGDTVQNLNAFTDALVKGNTRAFERIGIFANVADAERKFFTAMGATKEQAEKLRATLTEGEKANIARAASIDAINKKLSETSKPALDAADRIDQLQTQLSNFGNEALKAVANNVSLNQKLGELVNFIKNTDFTPFINGLTEIISVMVRLIEIAGKTAIAVGDVFDIDAKTSGSGVAARIEEFTVYEEKLKSVQSLIEKGDKASVSLAGGQLANISKDVDTPGLIKSKENAAQLKQEIDNLTITANIYADKLGLISKQGKVAFGAGALKQIEGVTGKIKKQDEAIVKTDKGLKSYTDRLTKTGGKADEAKQAFDQFKKSLDKAIDTGKFAAFEGAVERAFAKPQTDASLLAELTKIGAAAVKTTGAIDAVTAKIKEQQDIIKQGGFGPGNDAGAAEAEKNKVDPAKLFGFTIEGLSKELAGTLEEALSTALSIVGQALTTGIGREDAAAIGGSIGSGIAEAIAPGSGPIGQAIGTIVGQLASELGKDSAGTKARKAADSFFADIFDAQRLSVIINGQIKQIQDLQFTGNEDATFEGVAPQVQASFQAVGAAFEQLLGISEDYSGRIASVLLGNIGDSLVNLQALVQSTGKSFEDLGNAIFESFFNGTLSIQEAQNALVKLNEVFQVGIPGQIGAIDQAVQNLQVSLANDKGSRIIFNSLRGIGAEALEVGKNLGQAAQSIAAGLGLGADKVAQFLQAMKLAGINSVQELVDASNAKLLALAANIKQITAGEDPTNTEVKIPTTSINSATNFTPISTPNTSSKGGSRGVSDKERKRKAEEAERLRRLQQLQNETLKAVTASTAYKSILDQITAGTIDSNVAGNKLNELYSNQFKVLETLRNAQEAYDKALKNGTKGKDLTALAAALKKAQEAADGLKAPLANISKLDLKNVVGAIKDLNQLGIISQISGVKVEELQNTLTAGFLRGLISITEYNERLKATKDLLGAGIPGAVGAFEKAFANIANAGKAGGVFLIDAIRDVAAEFDEFFKQNSSSARKKQLQELRGNFDNARDALQGAISSGASTQEIQTLQDQFTGAKKAFEDFQSSSNKASIGDLKTELQKTFDPGDVDIYFEALRQNGITSIEQLTGASNEQLTTIAATLDELGFNFKATNGDIKNLLDNTNKAVADAAGGKDPLITALDATKALQDNIAALASPMGTLQAGFQNVLQTLDLFADKTFNTTVLLNVKTVYDGQAENLVTAIFGDGGVAAPQSPEAPGPSPATPGKKLNDAQRREFDALRRLKRRTSAQQARLEALQAIRSGA